MHLQFHPCCMRPPRQVTYLVMREGESMHVHAGTKTTLFQAVELRDKHV